MQRTATIKRPKELTDLLEPSLMARIGQLDVASRKIFAGKLKGERRSKKRGESVEFADHRSYVVGDDIRHIDWNLFARLDHLFLKLFLEEEDLSLHIVLDCSASNDCGEPNKFLFMQKLAMALSYIGLVNLNRVALSAIGSEEGNGSGLTAIRDLRGRRRTQDIAQFLCTLEPVGTAPFTEACKRIALTRRGKGVMVVLSDFFIKEGYETGLRLLVGHGYDLFAIQVLSPEEVDPKITGDLRLKDVEDADLAEVTISAPLLKRYKANLNAYCDHLHEFCVRRDIQHMTVKSDTPIDVFVLEYLRKRGLLK
jgi:uncharacterized protein (DUF58 family)